MTEDQKQYYMEQFAKQFKSIGETSPDALEDLAGIFFTLYELANDVREGLEA